MKLKPAFVVVLVTAPDRKTARQLARAALESKLIACANLVAGIESHYWWQGELESGREVLLLLKTTRRRVGSLKKLILAQHPYVTAEFVVLPIADGSPKYLEWLAASVR
jgi:periplasmic divalent cation tolerance protein